MNATLTSTVATLNDANAYMVGYLSQTCKSRAAAIEHLANRVQMVIEWLKEDAAGDYEREALGRIKKEMAEVATNLRDASGMTKEKALAELNRR
jgi:hypothetical protein